MLSQRKKYINNKTPYWYNDNISVFYEMKHGNDQIIVGTPLRFKYDRSVYSFLKLVHHGEKNTSWIDCQEKVTGVYKSFYVNELKGVVKPKKKRKKRVNVGTGTG